jgi:hypothetical protein
VKQGAARVRGLQLRHLRESLANQPLPQAADQLLVVNALPD